MLTNYFLLRYESLHSMIKSILVGLGGTDYTVSAISPAVALAVPPTLNSRESASSTRADLRTSDRFRSDELITRGNWRTTEWSAPRNASSGL